MGAVLDVNLIVIGLIRLQVSKNCITGIIIGNTGSGWVDTWSSLPSFSITNGEFSDRKFFPIPERNKRWDCQASDRASAASDRVVFQELEKEKQCMIEDVA